jgi:hypothetical protein
VLEYGRGGGITSATKQWWGSASSSNVVRTAKWIMLEFLLCPKWLDRAYWLWHGSIHYHRFYYREGWDASIEAVGSAASHTCTMNALGHESWFSIKKHVLHVHQHSNLQPHQLPPIPPLTTCVRLGYSSSLFYFCLVLKWVLETLNEFKWKTYQ